MQAESCSLVRYPVPELHPVLELHLVFALHPVSALLPVPALLHALAFTIGPRDFLETW